MDIDLFLGCILIVTALGIITSLVIWSRYAIHRIAEKHLHSARDIALELHNDGSSRDEEVSEP